MKKVKYLLLFFSFIMLASCSDDEITEPQKPESKDVISLGYEGKQFDFKNFHYGKYTNEDRELIGFLAEAEIVIDDKHKNRSEEHTSELQSRPHLVCRLLLE